MLHKYKGFGVFKGTCKTMVSCYLLWSACCVTFWMIFKAIFVGISCSKTRYSYPFSCTTHHIADNELTFDGSVNFKNSNFELFPGHAYFYAGESKSRRYYVVHVRP